MTTERRLERDLPQILGELAIGPYPDYIEDILATTAQRRQRAAWTFPERWIPMAVVTRRPVLAPNAPWRALGTLALLGLLVAAAVAAYVGSQAPLPAPFGPARNGMFIYADLGLILAWDPVAGTDSMIIDDGPIVDHGPFEWDFGPRFSLDGTHIVFERKATYSPDVPGPPGQLHVARSDGSEIVQVTPEAITNIESYAFSPDGQQILISAGLDLHVANTDGSGMRPLAVGGLLASAPDYSAPDGAEIVFVGRTIGATATGLYAVQSDGNGLRTIVEPTNLVIIGPRWSPDGSRIAYSAHEIGGSSPMRAYVVTADGQSNRLLRVLPAQNELETVTDWSNDGARLLVEGCYDDPADDVPVWLTTYCVIPVDGNGPVARMDAPTVFRDAESTWHIWAPDDGTILTVPLNFEGIPRSKPLLWDPLTGRSLAWAGPTVGRPSWQRLAP